MTEYGKKLRKIRIDNGEILKTMAEKLRMTSSYLSAIECGKRNIPASMTKKIAILYELNQEELASLEEAEQRSSKAIELSLSDVTEKQQDLALKFARTFKNIDDETANKIKELLRSKEENK